MGAKNKYFHSENVSIGLPTELCGFIDGVYYNPKSFGGFGLDINNCYNGLFYLIGDFNSKNDFKIYKTKHFSNKKYHNPLILQIYIAYVQILILLRKSGHKKFNKHIEISSKYSGKINFAKTANINKGLVGKVYKTLNSLSQSSIEFKFLLVALPYVLSLIKKYLSKEITREMELIVAECLNYLQFDINSNYEIYGSAVELIQRPVIHRPGDELISNCRVLAEFIISNDRFYSPEKETNKDSNKFKIKQNDFVLNLNRPFENLLKAIVKKLSESESEGIKFSKIESLLQSGGKKNTYPLIPDVWREFRIEENDVDERCLMIFDAKHKEFGRILSDDNSSNDLLSFNRINRSDLHQLISYIRTNLVNNSRGIFGFFGFIKEDNMSFLPNYKDSFIDCSRDEAKSPNPLVIDLKDYAKESSIYINLLGLRFASLLSLIGETCRSDRNKNDNFSLNDLYSRLAIELVWVLFQDEVFKKSEMLIRTINRNLSEASRSLFYIYKNSENFLEEIAEHILRKFLQRTDFKLQKNNTSFAFHGERLNYKIFANSLDEKLIILDTIHDSSLIFDEFIKDPDFLSEGKIIISTRHSLSIRVNTSGANPSVFLD